MAAEGNRIIKLKSNDGVEFEVTESEGSISEFIKDTTEESGEAVTVDVPRVNGACLEKIVEFMKHYKEDKMMEIPTKYEVFDFEAVRLWTTYFCLDSFTVYDTLLVMMSATFLNALLLSTLVLVSNVIGYGPTMVSRFCRRKQHGTRAALLCLCGCKLHGNPAAHGLDQSQDYFYDHWPGICGGGK